ncbi:hypothetical protein ACP6OW_004283, partial [Cronobacter turicensis]
LNFRIFLSSLRLFREVLHIAVSMEAHYRDLSFQHNPFFDLFFQLLFFHAYCCDPARSAQRTGAFTLAHCPKSNQSLLTLDKKPRRLCLLLYYVLIKIPFPAQASA